MLPQFLPWAAQVVGVQPVQMPETQLSPVGQSVLLAQPQAPATQIWPDMLVVQLVQRCPLEPQVLLAVPVTHVFVLLSQHPLLQVLPAQQGCPVPPQALAQVPLLQVRPLLQALPLQHDWPDPPQVVEPQVPALQVRLLLQAVPAQQGWPEAPQPLQVVVEPQVPPLQDRPLLQVLPLQQGWPEAPHAALTHPQVLVLKVWPVGQVVETQLPLQSAVPEGQVQVHVLRFMLPPGQFGTQLPLQRVVLGGHPHWNVVCGQ